MSAKPAALLPAQRDAAMEGRVGEPVRLGDGLWCLPVPTHTRSPVATLCYVIEGTDGSLHVVDPGVAATTPAQWRELFEAVGLRTDRVATIAATHMHPDHLGGVAGLAELTGASVHLGARELEAMASAAAAQEAFALDDLLRSWSVPAGVLDDFAYLAARAPRPEAPHPDRTLRDGDLLDIPGRFVTVLETPGHTPGHLCLDLPDEGRILVGDVVLPTMFPGIGLGGASDPSTLREYHRSLDTLEERDGREVLPGHGYCFAGLADRVAQTRRHHARRTSEVAAALDAGAVGVWDIASRLTWTAGWPNLRGYFLFSALQQTAMHRDYLRETAS